MMDGEEIRERYDAEINKHTTEIKTLATQRDHILKKIEVLDKFKKQGVHSEEDIEELMSILCYKNLAYCCRPKTDDGNGKKCMWRQSVLKTLGIPKEEFMAAKEKAVDGLLSPILNKK